MGVNNSGSIFQKLINISRFKSLHNDLKEGLSHVLSFLGDSIGNEITEYVYLLAQKFAEKYPNYNIRYKLYNAGYGAWIEIQNIGEQRHLLMVSGTGDLPYVSGSSVVLASPNLDFDFEAAPTSWTNVANNYLCSKAGLNIFCWAVRLVGTYITFYYSPTGLGADAVAINNARIDTTGWVDGTKKFIRFKVIPDNGAGEYTITTYTKDNEGDIWTQVSTYTGAGTLTINASASADYYLGGKYSGGQIPGKYYSMHVRDGIDGYNMFPETIDDFIQPVDPVVGSFAGNPTLYFFNASVPGAQIANFNEPSNSCYVKKTAPVTRGATIFFALGHNDNVKLGASYLAEWDTFLSLVLGRMIAPNCVLITQNPIMPPAVYIHNRQIRHKVLTGWAIKNNINIIDTYKDFLDSGRPLSDFVNASDGLHLLALGSIRQRDKIWYDIGL